MGFLNKYKTDKAAELAGVWIEVDETDAGKVEWKIARLNNEKARAERKNLEKPYRNFSQTPDSVSEDILRKVVARHVLLDWRNMTDEDGAVMEYSAESAEALFVKYPDMLNDVVSAAMARETFQTEGVEAAKND
jgi:hypothetical protein